jgi:Dyp-type peroxidase family
MITATAQAKNDKKKIVQHKQRRAKSIDTTPEFLAMAGVNVAFSKKGLDKVGHPNSDAPWIKPKYRWCVDVSSPQMGITDDIGDSVFNNGMLLDAKGLGDKGTESSGPFDPQWLDEYKEEIHGVILVTGDSHKTVKGKLEEIKDIFSVGEDDATVHEVLSVVGDVRPGKLSAHEQFVSCLSNAEPLDRWRRDSSFGFLDSISQPAVQGVDTDVLPGQEPPVRQGIILLGREGDAIARPTWALDGSFLAFRHLSQHVPEFDWFLKQNPIPSAPPELGSELLGARLVGRWKSGTLNRYSCSADLTSLLMRWRHAGAPIDITPLKDDPDLAKDKSRNNDFHYDRLSQERCPFAAHTRKTFPRSDIDSAPFLESRRIIRHGIQFGPEVSPEEAATNKSDPTKDRGLLFVAYQSNITNGFQFIQQRKFTPSP